MLEVASGQKFTAAVEGAPAGLAGTITLAIEDGDGNEVYGPSTVGIIEVDPDAGVYERANLDAPTQGGYYLLVWDDQGGGPDARATEQLRVLYSAGPGPPSGGLFPFTDAIAVLARDGDVLADAAGRVWPVGEATTETGEAYDYAGVVTGQARDQLVNRQNRVLGIGADRYHVVTAIWLPILHYVEVRLRQAKAQG